MRKWECEVCGYIHKGDDAPEKCPVCDSPVKMFKAMAETPQEKEEGEAGPGKRWRCTVCGYIHSGDEPPELCPVCAATKNFFVEIDMAGKTIGVPAAGALELTVATGVGGKVKSSFAERLARIIMKMHLHPITVHFPNGVLPVVVAFLGLSMIFNIASLETAAYYNLIAVLVMLPVVLLTGFFEWQKRYKGVKTTIFITKIICGILVLAAANVLVFWRFLDPAVVTAESPFRLIYLGIAGGMLVIAGLAGYLGGKLVFGKRG